MGFLHYGHFGFICEFGQHKGISLDLDHLVNTTKMGFLKLRTRQCATSSCQMRPPQDVLREWFGGPQSRVVPLVSLSLMSLVCGNQGVKGSEWRDSSKG